MKALFLKSGMFIIILLAAQPAAVHADGEIYVRVDDKGAHYYTDTPGTADYVKAPSGAASVRNHENAGRYGDIIDELSRNSGLRPELVKAVIRTESGFNPRAVSPKGARGLMQLMPVQTRADDIDDAFDPRQNIEAGTRYLGRLIERYNGNLSLSLAAYNAGPAAVDHYDGIPPYLETRRYVQKVLLYYRQYRKESGQSGDRP
ncbi:MAG: lytic transglycosylase domain-containing protein [Desulfosalsimonas sp.]